MGFGVCLGGGLQDQYRIKATPMGNLLRGGGNDQNSPSPGTPPRWRDRELGGRVGKRVLQKVNL